MNELYVSLQSNPEVQLLIGGEDDKRKLFCLMLEEYKGNVKQTIYNFRNYLKIEKVEQYKHNTYIDINLDDQLGEWLQEVFLEIIHNRLTAIKQLMKKNNWTPKRLLLAHIKSPTKKLTQFINLPWAEI